MEHPTLNETEKLIVRRTQNELLKVLAKSDVPQERWSSVALAVVVELAGTTLELYEGRTLLPREALCKAFTVSPRGHAPLNLRCTRGQGHAGPCLFEESPP